MLTANGILAAMPMTDEELDDVERRCSAATPAPWKSYVEGRDHTSGSNFIDVGDGNGIELSGATSADQDFIAHARQDVPRLVEEVRRLRALVSSRR